MAISVTTKEVNKMILKQNKKVKNESILASVAKKITTSTANSTCIFLAHQPKLPNSAKKLRKF